MGGYSRTKDVAERITEINLITQKLQQTVESEDWQMVNELLLHRQQCLETFFKTVDVQTQAAEVVQWLQQIKQQDQEMENQIKQQQASIRQVLNQLGKGRKAVDAYRSL